mgnify:CR=1 FL=1
MPPINLSASLFVLLDENDEMLGNAVAYRAVSYTHLTLPTKLEV